jgi:hypothetical protein
MNKHDVRRIVVLLVLFPVTLMAQMQRDVVPLRPWPAPLFWQPTQGESRAAAVKPEAIDNAPSADINATTPAGSLVFVGMTPCRVADTRSGSGFTGAFGPPSLVGGASRTFPIRSSPNCPVPAVAEAYSFNITLVTFSFVDFITVWPTGQPRPNASTLNGYVNTVIANAAIVPAGTGGSIDVYASQTADVIIDINGYYAPQTGITLAQGTAASPSLSFAGDAGTGIYSAGAGTLNIATGGTDRLSIASNGDLNVSGRLNANAGEFVTGAILLPGNGLSAGLASTYPGNSLGVGIVGYASDPTGENAGVLGLTESSHGVGGVFQNFNPDGAAISVEDYNGIDFLLGTAKGNVGIGAESGLSRLTVKAKESFIATGTVSADGVTPTVTGSGTKFGTEIGIGDRVTISGIDKIVTSVSSDTQLTTLSAFPASSGVQMTVHPGIFRIDNPSGSTQFFVSDQGNVQVGALAGVFQPKLLVAQSNPFAGTSTASPSESQPGITVRTNNAQAQDVGPMLGFSGQRGTSTSLFGGIRGAKENSTSDGVDTTLGRNGYLGFYTSQGPSTFAERMRITSAGKVGIGASSPTRELEVNGGVRLNTAIAKPACDATSRGTFWVTQGGGGTKDTVEVCAKDASDAYAWRTLY